MRSTWKYYKCIDKKHVLYDKILKGIDNKSTCKLVTHDECEAIFIPIKDLKKLTEEEPVMLLPADGPVGIEQPPTAENLLDDIQDGLQQNDGVLGKPYLGLFINYFHIDGSRYHECTEEEYRV